MKTEPMMPTPETTPPPIDDRAFERALQGLSFGDWPIINKALAEAKDQGTKTTLFNRVVEALAKDQWRHGGFAVLKSEDPEMKVAFLKAAIDAKLKNKWRISVVWFLKDVNASELDVPEYGDEFIQRLYDECVAKGKMEEAHQIAQSMSRSHEKIVQADVAREAIARDQVWDAKEKSSFEAWATSLVSKAQDDFHANWQIEDIFRQMSYRSGENYGLRGETRNDTVMKIAERAILNRLNGFNDAGGSIGRADPYRALEEAISARMPKEFIKKIRLQVSPTVVDRIEQLFNEIVTYKVWENKE